MKNIVLIGFMGSGKTSVGLALSRKLKRRVYDVDALIEAQENKKIAAIFDERGEAFFRQLEKKKIEELAGLEGAVITTGGGAVTDPDNVRQLKRNGTLVLLSAAPETILKRVGRSKSRPLIRGAADPKRAVEDLLAKRRPMYENAADLTVATDGRTSEEVAAVIETILKEQEP